MGAFSHRVGFPYLFGKKDVTHSSPRPRFLCVFESRTNMLIISALDGLSFPLILTPGHGYRYNTSSLDDSLLVGRLSDRVFEGRGGYKKILVL